MKLEKTLMILRSIQRPGALTLICKPVRTCRERDFLASKLNLSLDEAEKFWIDLETCTPRRDLEVVLESVDYEEKKPGYLEIEKIEEIKIQKRNYVDLRLSEERTIYLAFLRSPNGTHAENEKRFVLEVSEEEYQQLKSLPHKTVMNLELKGERY